MTLRRPKILPIASGFLLVVMFAILSFVRSDASTTQLPPGQVCFVGDGGQPMVNGSLNMYYVGTTNVKTTWQNASQTVANTNPLQLDSNGCVILFGIGTYRQQLYDGPVVGGVTTGNLIFDLPTTDTSAYNSVFWAGLAGGTPNVITIVDTGFNATDGTVINFTALSTNTGATTINPSGYGAISVEKQTTGGPVSLTGGEIAQGNVISVLYSATLNAFLLLNPPIQSASGNSNPLCGMSNLKITNNSGTPATEITMTAGDIVTTNTGGTVYNRTNPSVTINASLSNVANGLDTGNLTASTWYYVWWIDNGSAAAGLLSLSSTAPLLPSGYTTECRAGAMTTDSSANLMRTLQLGKRVQYIVGTDPAVTPNIVNGTAGTYSNTSPVFAAAAVAGNGLAVPPTASVVHLVAWNAWKGNSGSNIGVAPNANWGGTNNGPQGSNGGMLPFYSINTSTTPEAFDLVLESANIYWYSNEAGGAIGCMGWDDQVNAN